jgi:hypothetical protein
VPKMKSVFWVAAIALVVDLGLQHFQARAGVRR